MEVVPCPSTPNCVSTESFAAKHQVAPFHLLRVDAWAEIHAIALTLPRTKLAEEQDHFIHLECRSPLFGFVDDLVVQLRPEKELLAVRSAARIGYYDFGVNRRRVEKLREMLQLRGIVR